MSNYFTLICAILLLFSCDNSTQSGNIAVVEPSFFDVKGHFENLAAELEDKNLEITKKVTVNGDIETKIFVIEDWEKELALFIDSDINKPTWTDKYERIHEGSSIVFQLKEGEELKTERIEIFYLNEDKTISNIEIENETENLLFYNKQSLKYDSKKGFTIINTQKIVFLEEKVVEVEVLF